MSAPPNHAARLSVTSTARRSRGGLLLQSSGTTGVPKIVRRSVEALDAVSENMVKACGFGEDDHVLAIMPLCHSYGIEHGLLAPMWAGSCVHAYQGFELPVVMKELAGGSITLFPGVPFMFEIMASMGGDLYRFGSLRKAYSAGGPLPRAVYDLFLDRFGHRIGQLYGASEIGSVTFNDPQGEPFDPGSVGVPMEGVSVRILDINEPRIDRALAPGEEGQVAIAAPSMLSEYVGEDGGGVPLLDGHMITGDLGKVDQRGALTITGRLKLLIDVGGMKVNPAEVEEVLKQHPAVGDCVVVPMEISGTVWRLKAILTPRGDATPSAEELRRYARGHLTAYKVPRIFEVRPALPKSATGKVLRHLVDER